MSGASIINFEHVTLYIAVNIAEFEQIKASWV